MLQENQAKHQVGEGCQELGDKNILQRKNEHVAARKKFSSDTFLLLIIANTSLQEYGYSTLQNHSDKYQTHPDENIIEWLGV